MKRAFLLPLAIAVACSAPGDSTPTRVTGPDPHAARTTIKPSVGVNSLFGPDSCVRTTGKPVVDTVGTFGNTSGPDSAYLKITDNGVRGLNGTIELNGVVVVSHAMLGGNAPLNDSVHVALTHEQNTIVCKLEGKPRSGVNIVVTP